MDTCATRIHERLDKLQQCVARHLNVFLVLCQRVVLNLADFTVLGLCDSALGKQVKCKKNIQKSENIRRIDPYNLCCRTGCG